MKRTKQESSGNIKALAQEIALGIKSQEDLSAFTSELLKNVVEAALNVELTNHLGYEKNASEGRNSGNSRNGYSRKRLKGSHGELEIALPRDRTPHSSPN